MTSLTLKRLLEASRLPDEPPIRVPDGPAQLAMLESMQRTLDGDGATAHVSKWDKHHVLTIEPLLPGRDDHYRYRYGSSLRLSFTKEELQIAPHYGAGSVPVASLAQVQRIVAAVRDKLIEEQRREQKREKLRKLKERAIESQIEALARRLRFAWMIQPMRAKVKLFVQLDPLQSLQVDIAYGRFQETLAGLPELIESMRGILARGHRFQLIANAQLRGFRQPGPA